MYFKERGEEDRGLDKKKIGTGRPRERHMKHKHNQSNETEAISPPSIHDLLTYIIILFNN